jgi:thiamine biosynthesis lipoprotein
VSLTTTEIGTPEHTATDLITTASVVTHELPAMGSVAELMVIGGAGSLLVEWAVWRLGALEALWSRFLPESELCGLDRRAGTGPVSVSPETVDAVGRALSLWYVTDGRFDPTVRRALEACGYDRTFRLVAPAGPALAQPPRPAPGCDGIRVDHAHSMISLPAGVALDLGGIGKGLAADLVATGLVARGAAGACVALGGDVRVAGRGPHGGAWTIEIEDPLDESKILFRRTLAGGAVVTSTTRFRRWTRGGTVLHHIIDPTTGTPAARGVTAVIASADAAWWAEGIAKAALVAGIDDGLELLERLGVAAVIVGDRGDHYATSYWAQ